MFCVKCGSSLNDNAKFCVNCGTPVKIIAPPQIPNGDAIKITDNEDDDKTVILNQEDSIPSVIPTYSAEPVDIKLPDSMPIPEKPQSQKQGGGKKIILIIALIIVVLCLAGTAVYLGSIVLKNRMSETSFSGYLKKAEACMEQEDFEGAISHYLEAMELEPDNPEVYEGLADAYEQKGEPEKAQRILEKGYEETEDEGLLELLKKYEPEETEDEKQEESAEDSAAEANTANEAEEPYAGVRKNVNIEVHQVDNSNFPEVVFYTSITDDNGNTVENMKVTDFDIQEIDAQGNVQNAEIEEVYQVLNEDKINVNLVLDASGSMYNSQKMEQAKNAAKGFLDKISLETGDKVEVISFDDYVYLEQEFTSQRDLLTNAVDNTSHGGETALYDALYAGLYQTYYETGAKCVIAFTDGAENTSSYSFNDVINMAQNTGIPVFIIGIGEEYDIDVLQSLATQCSGQYYSANVNELETILEDIYLTIYREQQDYYVFKYTSENLDNPQEFREILVETSETSEFFGTYRKSYVPQADITGAFSSDYMNLDFIIADSASRSLTESDLSGLSLAELRIARNEIFARHGRQFRDPMLNQWFYSKAWYLNIPSKYAPDVFDAIRPSPLSKTEIDNANFIKAYEDNIMSYQDIYPDASNTLLSDYDLALSKTVLKTALAQMQTYPSSDILNENMRMVRELINKGDVQY